jgi:hypothetical protein
VRAVAQLLPFLCLVLVQDGIYRVQMFPDHPVSRFLVHKFGPRYLQWAEKQREKLEKEDFDGFCEQLRGQDEQVQANQLTLKRDMYEVKRDM